MRIAPATLRTTRLLFVVAVTTAAFCLTARAARREPARQLPPASGLAGPGTLSRRVPILDFTHLAGPTAIVFRYTSLAPGAAGQAEIDPAGAWLKIHGMFNNLPAATRLGPQDLTYTLWQVTPDGRTTNLGEIEVAGSDGEIHTKSRSHRFGLMVTAEPYFAVSQPSSAVALEADVMPGGAVSAPLTQVTCELLQAPVGSELVAKLAPDPGAAGEPLLFEEARRVLAIARASGAAEYAPQTLGTAEQTLQIAGKLLAQHAKPADVHDAALEAVLIAEDARVLAVVRKSRAQAAPVVQDPAP